MMKHCMALSFLLVGTSFAVDPILCKSGDTPCGSICVNAGGIMICDDGACTPSNGTALLISNGLIDLAGVTEENCLVPENECGGVYCPEGQECDANISCVATPPPTPAPTPGVTCEDLNYCTDVAEACIRDVDAVGAECVAVTDLCKGSTEDICATADDLAEYYYNPKDQGWQTPGRTTRDTICVASGLIDCDSSGSKSLMVGSFFGLMMLIVSVAVIEV